MSTIDLSLPDFLRAENRRSSPRARKDRTRATRSAPISAGAKSQRPPGEKPADAGVRSEE